MEGDGTLAEDGTAHSSDPFLQSAGLVFDQILVCLYSAGVESACKEPETFAGSAPVIRGLG